VGEQLVMRRGCSSSAGLEADVRPAPCRLVEPGIQAAAAADRPETELPVGQGRSGGRERQAAQFLSGPNRIGPGTPRQIAPAGHPRSRVRRLLAAKAGRQKHRDPAVSGSMVGVVIAAPQSSLRRARRPPIPTGCLFSESAQTRAGPIAAFAA